MIKQIERHDGKKIYFSRATIFISFIIIVIELFYLFKFSRQEDLSKKRKKLIPINVLNLVGRTNKQEFLQNIIYKNNILMVNNTFGTAAKGNFVYINRTSAIPIIDNFIVELKFFKKKGASVAVDLISANTFDYNNIHIGNEGFEISLSGDNEIHVISFNIEKKIREIYYVGKMPSNNFLRIEVVKNFISVKDSEKKDIGTIFFTHDPFKEKKEMFIGLKLGPNSIMNISQFLIYTKQESP